ncbi:MAG: RluA family pseudouridine synthase [Opitutales bacterium]|nr:RluA family pseudouridine synthase [Opitutales bacterium]
MRIETTAPAQFGTSPLLIEPEAFRDWIVREDERLLVLDKPGWVVCHPSKNGPWSSLVGAAREYLGGGAVHLVSRLDRETSGLVILAKDRGMARALQMAVQSRRVDKTYLAVLEGVLEKRLEVSRPLERDAESPVAVKQRVGRTGGGQKAQTSFIPREHRGGCTLAEVIPHTGRKHQIRAHAQWAGFPVAGDKLYGPDPLLYLHFIEAGWTPEHARRLRHFRQALHAARLAFDLGAEMLTFEAPLAPDLAALWAALGE